MDRSLTRDSPAPLDKRAPAIAGMFDAIASRYDLLNTVLSGGIDRYWRMRAVRALGLRGTETVVDVCTGTGDLALALARHGAKRVVGLDFAGEMLRVGLRKVRRQATPASVGLARGDATALPLQPGTVDAVTIAFGIRNVEQPELACRECARVLRPGGKLAILEFGMPRTPVIGRLYRLYFTRVLPRVGRLVSHHRSAYTYLPASVGSWARPSEFASLLKEAGFTDVRAVPLTLGVVYLFTGRRA
jgi:demethylmenaquinone methyltransferase / 2-methoxy-6-polyprenyl-1,4-benzoquinol methylase